MILLVLVNEALTLALITTYSSPESTLRPTANVRSPFC